ncbi:MAG: HupE/UreJ family protein [Gemmatimonadaceae bacterium]|nr:HupE/UreJ family protein [Gemmatimonadaceae bacterium]
MSSFGSFLALGLHHILTPEAADHLLFLATLALAHELGGWRQLLVLITAFTIGHSLTLALATLNLVHPDTRVVEALIPGTIVVTSVVNLWTWRRGRRANDPPATDTAGRLWPRYTMALTFGLIHGLGFSSVLRGLLGDEESIVMPLLAFNLGIELAQVIVLVVLAVIGALLVGRLTDRRGYVLAASGVTLGCATQMLLARL